MVDEHFLKVVEKKQKNIEEEVTNQQVKYFMALRDRKIAFVNKMYPPPLADTGSPSNSRSKGRSTGPISIDN